MVRRYLTAARAVVLALLLSISCQTAFAQGFVKKNSDLPDASKFYMARQQITITDDSPIINRKDGGGGKGKNGALPSGPLPLPKSGWQPYSQTMPGLQTSLPKVNNGVPVKAPPISAKAKKAKGGGLQAVAHKSKPAAPQPNPNAVQAYAPYKGYGAPASGSGSADNVERQSNTNVKGSLLHWARGRRHY
jgi:hypothetical protein